MTSLHIATDPSRHYLPLPLPDPVLDHIAAAIDYELQTVGLMTSRTIVRKGIETGARTLGQVAGVGIYHPDGTTAPQPTTEPDPRIDQIQTALRTLADLTVKGHDATERVLDHVVRIAKRDAIRETVRPHHTYDWGGIPVRVDPNVEPGTVRIDNGENRRTLAAWMRDQQRIAELERERDDMASERDEAVRKADTLRGQVDRQQLTIRAYMDATHTTDPEDVPAYGLHNGQDMEPEEEGRVVLTCVSKDGTDLEVEQRITRTMTPYLRFVMAPKHGHFIGHHMAPDDVRRLRDHLTAVLGS